MLHKNGLDALRSLTKAVEAEADYLRTVLNEAEAKGAYTFSEAHMRAIDAVLSLNVESEGIRMSAERWLDSIF